MSCSSGNSGTVNIAPDGSGVLTFVPATDGFPFEDPNFGTWSGTDWWIEELHFNGEPTTIGRTSTVAKPSFVTSVVFAPTTAATGTQLAITFNVDIDLLPTGITGILIGVAATSSSQTSETTGDFCLFILPSFSTATRANIFFVTEFEGYIATLGDIQNTAIKVCDVNTGLTPEGADQGVFDNTRKKVLAGWSIGGASKLGGQIADLLNDTTAVNSTAASEFTQPDNTNDRFYVFDKTNKRIETWQHSNNTELATLTSQPSGNSGGVVQAGPGGDIFWCDDGNDTSSGVDNIHKVTPGGAVTVKYGSTNTTGSSIAGSMHYHSVNGLVYMLAGTTIKRWDPSSPGNTAVNLYTHGASIRSLTVDEALGHIYFADPAAEDIYRINLDGTGVTLVDDTWTAAVTSMGGVAWLQPENNARTEGTQLYIIYATSPHSTGDRQREGEGPIVMDANLPTLGVKAIRRANDYRNIGQIAFDDALRIYTAGYLNSDGSFFGRIWRTNSEGIELSTILTTAIASNVGQWCMVDHLNGVLLYIFDNTLGTVNVSGTSDTIHTSALGDDVIYAKLARNGTHAYLVRGVDGTTDYVALNPFSVVRTLTATEYDTIAHATAVDTDSLGNVYIYGSDGTGIFYEVWNSDLTTRSSSVTLNAGAGGFAINNRAGFAYDEANTKVYYATNAGGIRVDDAGGGGTIDFLKKSTRPHFINVRPYVGSIPTAI